MSSSIVKSDKLRELWCSYWEGFRLHTASGAWRNSLYPAMPEVLTDLMCGALTRAGSPCKRRDLYWSGRCRLHGGLSTGPLTEAGKAQARINGAKGGRPPKGKPKPMKGLTKPQGFPASATRPVSEVSNEGVTTAAAATRNLIPAQDDAAALAGQTSVRCISCHHMSAGFTCLLGTQLQGTMPAWAWRACPRYVASASEVSSASV